MRKWLLSLALLASACSSGEDAISHTEPDAPPGANGASPPPASPSPSPQTPSPSGGGGGELAIAATLPAQCTGPEIFRVDRAVATNDPSMGHYAYGFRFKPPTAAGAPVLVYLPGGPGITSIDEVPT